MFFSVEMIGHNKIYPLENIIRAVFYNVKLSFVDEYENKIISIYENNQVKTIIKIKDNIYYGIEHINKEHIELSKIENIIKLSFLDGAKQICDLDLPWGILIGIVPSKIATRLMEQGVPIDQIEEILQNDLKIKKDKIKLMLKAAYYEKKIKDKLSENSISLYISIPFCKTRCSYCTFISKTYESQEILDYYLDSIIYELESFYDRSRNYFIETIYIGGGTPTSFSHKQLYKLLSSISKFDLTNLKEYTVEAGRPDTITNEKLEVIKNFNVNRISINPQTLNDKTLKLIGRNHTSKEFYAIYELANKIGFDCINTDLICGLYGETINDFKFSLDEIVKLEPKNITVHTLSVKRGSKLLLENQIKRDQRTLREMLEYSNNTLINNNYDPYYLYRQKCMLDNLENIGYTKSNHECIYNIAVMNEIENIISFGGGAVSKIINSNGKISKFRNYKDADYYIKNYKQMTFKKQEFFNFNLGR